MSLLLESLDEVAHLEQGILRLLWAGFECLRCVDDGDGHEADSEIPVGGSRAF